MGWYNRCFFIVGGILMLLGCGKYNSGQQHTGKTNQEASAKNRDSDTDTISKTINATMASPEQNPDRIAPGTCRIVGKVIRILPKLTDDKNAPCGQVSCTALVQVQKVMGYGTAFNKPLSPNQQIKVYFSFTLNATTKNFPELTTPLPGLEAGDTFLTDLQYIAEQHPEEEHLYKVSFYKILK